MPGCRRAQGDGRRLDVVPGSGRPASPGVNPLATSSAARFGSGRGPAHRVGGCSRSTSTRSGAASLPVPLSCTTSWCRPAPTPAGSSTWPRASPEASTRDAAGALAVDLHLGRGLRREVAELDQHPPALPGGNLVERPEQLFGPARPERAGGRPRRVLPREEHEHGEHRDRDQRKRAARDDGVAAAQRTEPSQEGGHGPLHGAVPGGCRTPSSRLGACDRREGEAGGRGRGPGRPRSASSAACSGWRRRSSTTPTGSGRTRAA